MLQKSKSIIISVNQTWLIPILTKSLHDNFGFWFSVFIDKSMFFIFIPKHTQPCLLSFRWGIYMCVQMSSISRRESALKQFGQKKNYFFFLISEDMKHLGSNSSNINEYRFQNKRERETKWKHYKWQTIFFLDFFSKLFFPHVINRIRKFVVAQYSRYCIRLLRIKHWEINSQKGGGGEEAVCLSVCMYVSGWVGVRRRRYQFLRVGKQE